MYKGLNKGSILSTNLFITKKGLKLSTKFSRNISKYGCTALFTGEPSGLFVVDIDKVKRQGEKFPYKFLKKHGNELKKTLTQKTASGMTHHLFHLPDNPKCKNTTIKVNSETVDFMSNDSVIFAEPCCLKGKCYKWKGGFDLSKVKPMSASLQEDVCKDEPTPWIYRDKYSIKKKKENEKLWTFLTSNISETGIECKVKSVHDGDTFKCTMQILGKPHTYKCRVNDIDTPEVYPAVKHPTKEAHKSTKLLKKLILNKKVNIKILNIDAYGRLLVEVTKGYKNINEEMIKAGYYKKFVRLC